MTFRHLTLEEIEVLTQQGCRCKDWQQVKVAPSFSLTFIRDVTFSGHIEIGVFSEEMDFGQGLVRHSGMEQVALHDCQIGDNVFIHGVKQYISNYVIGDHVIIDNLNALKIAGNSSFGEAEEVLLEWDDTQKTVPIFSELSAQWAYLFAFSADPALPLMRKALLERLAQKPLNRGYVKPYARIENCGTLQNVKVGEYAHLEGVTFCRDITVNSSGKKPSYIGFDVMAENSIFSEGCYVTEGSHVSHCFVGQHCRLEQHFLAEHALLFAHGKGLGGEVHHAFLGPCSDVLFRTINLEGGYYPFFSAENAVCCHKVYAERGVTLLNNSALPQGGHIGAFSTVSGMASIRMAAECLPFSEFTMCDTVRCTPAVRLKQILLRCHAVSWQKRESDAAQPFQDKIRFKLFSPYTLEKMMEGERLLLQCREWQDQSTGEVVCRGMHISGEDLQNGIKWYGAAIDKYVGDAFIKKAQHLDFSDISSWRKLCTPEDAVSPNPWTDVAGWLLPSRTLQNFLDALSASPASLTPDTWPKEMDQIHQDYQKYEWNWVAQYLSSRYPVLTFSFLTEIMTRWRDASNLMYDALMEDVQRLKMEDHEWIKSFLSHEQQLRSAGQTLLAVFASLQPMTSVTPEKVPASKPSMQAVPVKADPEPVIAESVPVSTPSPEPETAPETTPEVPELQEEPVAPPAMEWDFEMEDLTAAEKVSSEEIPSEDQTIEENTPEESAPKEVAPQEALPEEKVPVEQTLLEENQPAVAPVEEAVVDKKSDESIPAEAVKEVQTSTILQEFTKQNPPQRIPEQRSLFDDFEEEIPQKPTLADRFQKKYHPINESFQVAQADLSQKLQHQPLQHIADGIGLNDKFLFTRELFKSNPQHYKDALAALDQCDRLQTALDYIQTHFDWKKNQPAVKKFMDLLTRRYSSYNE